MIIDRITFIETICNILDEKPDEVLMKVWHACFPETIARIYKFGESFEVLDDVSKIEQNKRLGRSFKKQDISSVEKMSRLP